MTNKICIAAFAALIFSAVFIFIAATSPGLPGDAAQTSADIGQAESDTVYTVKAFGNEIGIFVPGNDEPIKTISIDPKSLPEDAQLLLDNGITVTGHRELLLLIEDYVS